RDQIGENLNCWRKLSLVAGAIAVLAVPVLVGMMNGSPISTQASQNHDRLAATPKWELVSIRPCAAGAGQRGGEPSGNPFRFTPDRMTLRCLNVRSLIESAYKAYVDDASLPERISGKDAVLGWAPPALTTPIEGGPAWIDSERYMIEAKAEAIA